MSAMAGYEPKHFRWAVEDKVATLTLDRPERKNPLTFESCAAPSRRCAMPTTSRPWC